MSLNIDAVFAESDTVTNDNSVGVLTQGNDSAYLPSGNPDWWTPGNAMTISSAILLFGVAVIAIAAFTTPKDAPLESKLRLYGTIMVLALVGFVVVAGYDDRQIAAPLGLLGTIAGYLLGKSDLRESHPPAKPDVP